jgi:hypothetical protein
MLTVACQPDPVIAVHDVLMMTNYGNALPLAVTHEFLRRGFL